MGSIMSWLVQQRRHRVAREIMLFYGLDVPAACTIGQGFMIQHRGIGTVLHPQCTIGSNVTIYHQVTIGRADPHVPRDESPMDHICIEDDVILYPGAKVLGGPGVTRIGRGTIIGANAVVTRSTGDWEIWAGAPARKVGTREQFSVKH